MTVLTSQRTIGRTLVLGPEATSHGNELQAFTIRPEIGGAGIDSLVVVLGAEELSKACRRRMFAARLTGQVADAVVDMCEIEPIVRVLVVGHMRDDQGSPFHRWVAELVHAIGYVSQIRAVAAPEVQSILFPAGVDAAVLSQTVEDWCSVPRRARSWQRG